MVEKKRRRRRGRRPVIQKHHISYVPEVTVVVFVGEHYILSQLQWRKRFSVGFREALQDFLAKPRQWVELRKIEKEV